MFNAVYKLEDGKIVSDLPTYPDGTYGGERVENFYNEGKKRFGVTRQEINAVLQSMIEHRLKNGRTVDYRPISRSGTFNDIVGQ
jgi:hypothetical protein